jgi:hypothetical protein
VGLWAEWCVVWQGQGFEGAEVDGSEVRGRHEQTQRRGGGGDGAVGALWSDGWRLEVLKFFRREEDPNLFQLRPESCLVAEGGSKRHSPTESDVLLLPVDVIDSARGVNDCHPTCLLRHRGRN